MDPALNTLKATLEAIRDTAMKALSQIEQSQDERSMRLKCKECQYISILPSLFHWKPPADVLDAKARSLDLFCEMRQGAIFKRAT